jgi:hypothetical protein
MITEQLNDYSIKFDSLTKEEKLDKKILFTILSETIKEKVDGCPKSVSYMRAEYAVIKMQAVVSFRNSFFARKQLVEDFKMTEEDFAKLENDYYNEKIIRESYDDEYKPKTKAEFVNTSED